MTQCTLRTGGRRGARGHIGGVGGVRREAGPDRQPPEQQDLLLLLPHHQGAERQHGAAGRLPGEERAPRRL